MGTLLGVTAACTAEHSDEDAPEALSEQNTVTQPCPCCGSTMRIIEVFDAGRTPRTMLMPEGIDSS